MGLKDRCELNPSLNIYTVTQLYVTNKKPISTKSAGGGLKIEQHASRSRPSIDRPDLFQCPSGCLFIVSSRCLALLDDWTRLPANAAAPRTDCYKTAFGSKSNLLAFSRSTAREHAHWGQFVRQCSAVSVRRMEADEELKGTQRFVALKLYILHTFYFRNIQLQYFPPMYLYLFDPS